MKTLLAILGLTAALAFAFPTAPAEARTSKSDSASDDSGSRKPARNKKSAKSRKPQKTAKSNDDSSSRKKRATASRDTGGGGGQTGVASFYHEPQMTASGERFNPNAMTAAHRTLPLGSRVKVTNASSGKSVVVRINDRGPYAGGRIIDLSRAAAQSIGISSSAGLGRVRVERVN